MTHRGAVLILCRRSCDIRSPLVNLLQSYLLPDQTTYTKIRLFRVFSSLHSWVGEEKAAAWWYKKPQLKLEGIWTWIYGLGVHMQARGILCVLVETIWNDWPSRQEVWLISSLNTIGRSSTLSSLSAATFTKGTEFSVGHLTTRFFPENPSGASSSAVFLLQTVFWRAV